MLPTEKSESPNVKSWARWICLDWPKIIFDRRLVRVYTANKWIEQRPYSLVEPVTPPPLDDQLGSTTTCLMIFRTTWPPWSPHLYSFVGLMQHVFWQVNARFCQYMPQLQHVSGLMVQFPQKNKKKTNKHDGQYHVVTLLQICTRFESRYHIIPY